MSTKHVMFMRHTFNLLLDVNLQPMVLTVYSHHSELEYYTAMTTLKGGLVLLMIPTYLCINSYHTYPLVVDN